MKWLKEPLLHFVLIGAGLFVLFGITRGSFSSPDQEQVIVSAGKIEQLANIFVKTWQRPPTQDELKGLIDDYVIEEIYYRQAVEMGIDRDDTVIRRRLRQKLEFLTDDLASLQQPTDSELDAFLAERSEDFRQQSTYSFEQVYFNPETTGDQTDAVIARELADLEAGAAPPIGSGLLAPIFENALRQQVDGTFGTGFAEQLDQVQLGEWHGPIPSGVGLHLVRVHSRTEGSIPQLDDIRMVVEREWANHQRIEQRNRVNEGLLELYEVTVEWPDPT